MGKGTYRILTGNLPTVLVTGEGWLSAREFGNFGASFFLVLFLHFQGRFRVILSRLQHFSTLPLVSALRRRRNSQGTGPFSGDLKGFRLPRFG